jgi:hypothetical protein
MKSALNSLNINASRRAGKVLVAVNIAKKGIE